MVQTNTSASQETYRKLRIEANVLIRQKKKAWMNNKILQIEHNHKTNDARNFFQEIKKPFNRNKQSYLQPVRTPVAT